MNSFYLSVESDSELCEIVLSSGSVAAEMGISIRSGRLYLTNQDAQIYISAGTFLLTTIKIIAEIFFTKTPHMSVDALAKMARERIAEECERQGIKDFSVQDLTVVDLDGNRLVRAFVIGPSLDATVTMDELGNVTMTNR